MGEDIVYSPNKYRETEGIKGDKAKGIVCKPMPRTWHDKHAIAAIEDETERKMYFSMIADRKPYFMRYIYPALMKEYNTYIKSTDRNALREFHMTVAQLEALPEERRTERQAEFLKFFHKRMPVGMGDCVMNKICRRFEDAFDGYIGKHNAAVKFDYRFMRSDAEYTGRQFASIKSLHSEYNHRLINYAAFADYERVDEYESTATLGVMNEEFSRECNLVCSDAKALCNIILDISYAKTSTKRFAWYMCGDMIIQNLLEKNNYEISYPVRAEDGDFEYCGERFKVETKQIGAVE